MAPTKKHTHTEQHKNMQNKNIALQSLLYIRTKPSTLNIYHNVILQIRSLKKLMPTRYFAVYIRIKKRLNTMFCNNHARR